MYNVVAKVIIEFFFLTKKSCNWKIFYSTLYYTLSHISQSMGCWFWFASYFFHSSSVELWMVNGWHIIYKIETERTTTATETADREKFNFFHFEIFEFRSSYVLLFLLMDESKWGDFKRDVVHFGSSSSLSSLLWLCNKKKAFV